MAKFSFEKELFWLAVRGVIGAVWVLMTGVVSGAAAGFFFALEGGLYGVEAVVMVVAFALLGFTASLVFGRWV